MKSRQDFHSRRLGIATGFPFGEPSEERPGHIWGRLMFGWRKRIGYITPTVMELVPYEFYSFAPPGIGLVGVTCNIDDWKSTEYETGLAAVERSVFPVSTYGTKLRL